MTNNQNKIRAMLLTFGLLFAFSFVGCLKLGGREISKSTFVLNTTATITLYSGAGDEALIDSCFDLCREYEALFSRTDENSEISLLNQRRIDTVSAETAELIEMGLYYSKLSNGAFDISVEPLSTLWDFSSGTHKVPDAKSLASAAVLVDYGSISVEGNKVTFSDPGTRIDLGAIAKGYIADRMKEYLVSHGVERGLVNLGGNVLCIGGKTANRGVSVGILKPFGNSSIATITVNDRSVVTSGVYERCFEKDGVLYHHLLNTKSGYPIKNGLLSVSIVSPESVDGDALSTACFALGLDKGMRLIDSLEGIYALLITDDYRLHFSSGMEEAYDIKY